MNGARTAGSPAVWADGGLREVAMAEPAVVQEGDAQPREHLRAGAAGPRATQHDVDVEAVEVALGAVGLADVGERAAARARRVGGRPRGPVDAPDLQPAV